MLDKINFNKIVYIADDDEDDRSMFLDAVKESNLPIQVIAAEDGLRLLCILSEAEKCLPDIIFLDINMPGKNGLKCLEEIRSSEDSFGKVKIIMLSTSSDPENIDNSLKLGADFYAVKPSSFLGLKKMLIRIFELDWNMNNKSREQFLLKF